MATAKQQGQEQQQQDSWSEGMSKLMEASRHHMTATNLAAAGMIAIGAAATAYLWDNERRNQLFDQTKRLSNGMTSWWGGMAAPSINQ